MLLLWLNPVLCSADPPRRPRVTYESIREIIRRYDIRSVDALVAHLPQSLRQRYILRYQTGSPQGPASWENPRIILFDQGADLMVAFMANAPGTSGETVEITQRNRSQDFDYRLISFNSLAAGQRRPPRPRFDNHPTDCIRCHNGNPLYESYGLWPGVYGGDNSAFLEGTEEFRNFNQLRAAWNHNPRLGALPQYGITLVQMTEDDSGQTFSPPRPTHYIGTAIHNDGETPIELLQERILRHQIHRLARDLFASPSYPQFRLLLLAATQECIEPGGLAAYLPNAGTTGSEEQTETAHYVQASLISLRRRIDQMQRVSSIHRGVARHEEITRSAAQAAGQISFLLSRFGITLPRYNHSPDPDDLAFTAGQSNLRELLREELLHRPEFARLANATCENLMALLSSAQVAERGCPDRGQTVILPNVFPIVDTTSH